MQHDDNKQKDTQIYQVCAFISMLYDKDILLSSNNNNKDKLNYPRLIIVATKPITLKLVITGTIFIAGSLLSPLLLLSSPGIAYGQANSYQTPEQALSTPSPSEQQPPSPSNSSAPPPSPSNLTVQQALQQAYQHALSAPPQTPLSSSNQTITPAQQQQQGQPPQIPPPPPPPASSSPSSTIPGILPPTEQQPLPSEQQQIQPPTAAPTQGVTANGTIDSLIFAPGTRWIATGNWSMAIRNDNVNSFSTNMTWYNNNGTGTHTHELLNFRSSGPQIIETSGDNILLKGLMDVGTNHRITWTNVNSIVDIKGGKTIAISVDDKQTNNHFAGQTIYGVVTSFTRCSDIPGANMEVLEPCSSPPPSVSSSSPSS